MVTLKRELNRFMLVNNIKTKTTSHPIKIDYINIGIRITRKT